MTYIYPIIEIPPKTKEEDIFFAKDIKSPLFMANLLTSREINTKEKAKEFLLAEHNLNFNHNSFLNFEKGISSLQEMYHSQAKILVHGDYDVDGISGCALIYKALKKWGFNIDWFIPDRFKDGYGLTLNNVHKFYKQKFDWIITVDTGITAIEEIKQAKKYGIKTLITDHHQAGDTLPPANVIINPNQKNCNYNNKGLSGTGVAWRLINGFAQKEFNSHTHDLLYLVALANLADMMPMNQENRHMTRKGLRQLENIESPGLKILLQKINLYKKKITAMDVLFKITPLLNAPGRLQNANLTFQLLTCDHETQAEEYLKKIYNINEKRKKIDQSTLREAQEIINNNSNSNKKTCIVVSGSNWNEGVLGIVAAKLCENYQKPVLVLSISNDIAKGSGRSVKGFNLHKALNSCKDLLDKWGGHYYACGLTMKKEYIPVLKEKLDILAEEYLPDNFLQKKIVPHAKIPFKDIELKNIIWLHRLEPTGPLNPKPVFYSDNIKIIHWSIIANHHLSLTLQQEKNEQKAIFFNGSSLESQIKSNQVYHIAFTIEKTPITINNIFNYKLLELVHKNYEKTYFIKSTRKSKITKCKRC